MGNAFPGWTGDHLHPTPGEAPASWVPAARITVARSDTEVTLPWQFSAHGEALDVLRAQLAARLHTEEDRVLIQELKPREEAQK